MLQFSAGREKHKQPYAVVMVGAKLGFWTGPFKLHSRTDLINSSGCDGKLRASVPQQRNKIPVISSSSSLHSSQALMSCRGNSCALWCVCMCVTEQERGPEKPQSENYVSSERIRSPRFSQGLGILLLSCLRVLFNVNTHAHTHIFIRSHERCKPEMHSTKAETDDKED